MKRSLAFCRHMQVIACCLALLTCFVCSRQIAAQTINPFSPPIVNDIDTIQVPPLVILPGITSSLNGSVHTPKGNLHILIIFVGFNAPNSYPDNTNPNLPGTDGIWLEDDIPNWAKGSSNYLFDDDPATTTAGTGKKNLSKFYYEMSMGQFILTADIFPAQVMINPILPINSDYLTNNQNVFNWINTNYPNFDWGKFDNRDNDPSWNFDNSIENSDGSPASGDGKIDYVYIVYRNFTGHFTGVGAVSGAPFTVTTNISGSPQNYIITGTGGHIASDCKNNPNAHWTYFTHEFAHRLYLCPHYNGANNAHGNHFYSNNGWGMMGHSSGLRVLLCANAFERWYLGWIEIKHDLQSSADNGTYTLGDFITTGDAIRIKLPNVNNQYLWLENHQGTSQFDERDGAWGATDAAGVTFPNPPRGLLAFVENMASSRSDIISYSNTSDANSIKVIHANGNWDYIFDPAEIANPPTPANLWGNYIFDITTGAPNPLGSHNEITGLRLDYKLTDNTTLGIDGIINFNSYWNGGPNENHVLFAKKDGVFTHGYMGSEAGFDVSQKMGLGSNPAIINYQTYNSSTDKLSPVYLNGLSVKVLSIDGGGNMTVEVKFNDIEINNDTRFTGDIILSDVPGVTFDYDLNVLSGITLTIDKSGTPNKRFENTSGSGDFVNPTLFTCLPNTYFHMEANSTTIIDNGSTFILESGSKLEMHDNTQFIVRNGCKFIVEDGAEVFLHNNNTRIIIEDGAELINKNVTAGKGIRLGFLNVPNTAELRIEGTLTTTDNVDFRFINLGFISFYGNGNLNLGNNSNLVLTGLNKYDLVLKLGDNVIIDLVGHNINIQQGKVEYGQNSELKASNADVFLQDITLNGLSSIGNTGFYGNALSSFELLSSQVNNIGVGVFLENISDGVPVNFDGIDFSNSNTGIRLNNINNSLFSILTIDNVNISGGDIGVDISNSVLVSLNNVNIVSPFTAAVKAVNTIVVASINCNYSALGFSAVYLNYVDGYYMIGGSVYNNNIGGIYAYMSDIWLRNEAKIYNNNVGVTMYAEPGNYVMLTVGDVGCGSIYDNQIGVFGHDILLNIDAEIHACNTYDCSNIQPNRFDGNNNFTFWILYTGSAPTSQVLAKSNFWGGTSLSPTNYFIRELSNLNTPILVNSQNFTQCTPAGCANPVCFPPIPVPEPLFRLISCKSPVSQHKTKTIGEEFRDANMVFVQEDNKPNRMLFKDIADIHLTRTPGGKYKDDQGRVFEDVCVHLVRVAEVLVKGKTVGNQNARLAGNNDPDLNEQINFSERFEEFLEELSQADLQNSKIKDIIDNFNSEIIIYPNPAENEINISLGGVSSQIYELQLYNVFGQQVLSKEFNNNVKIDVSKLKKGIYLLKIIGESNLVKTQKIIKT